MNRRASMTINPLPERTACTGVGGWLLVLCLMLAVIGPLIAVGLMVNETLVSAPYFQSALGLHLATIASMAITAWLVGSGIYAGVGLWLLRPGAVETAKTLLLLGLAADIAGAALHVLAPSLASPHAGLLREVALSVVPDLIFFTACYAYLNKSARVRATYAVDAQPRPAR